MPPDKELPDKELVTFRLEPVLVEALKGVYERDGVTVSEQLRRAVRAWLSGRGIDVDALVKAQGRRATAGGRKPAK